MNFPRSGSERRWANIKKISSRRVRSGSSITKAMTAALYKKARTKCACILDFADRIEGSGLFADKASTSIAKLCRADNFHCYSPHRAVTSATGFVAAAIPWLVRATLSAKSGGL